MGKLEATMEEYLEAKTERRLKQRKRRQESVEDVDSLNPYHTH